MLDTLFSVTGSDAQRAFLEKAFASAGALASSAARYSANAGLKPAADEVFAYLFGTDQIAIKRSAVTLALEGISENATPVQGEPKGEKGRNSDVIVFCTHDRLKEGTAPDGSKRIFDSANKEFLKAKADCARAMAWTIVPNMDEDSDKPDIIQICPWFLDYAMKQDIQFQGQFKAGRTASMIVNLELDKLATWLKYTPIDLFQLFDKVMIHELSHTRRGGETVDAGGFDGYGWKNCRKLAAPGSIPPVPPNKNADSIALFASICGLIDMGGAVNEDGTFKRGAGHATKRGSSTPDGSGEPARVPAVTKRQALHFNAMSLKGRPLF